MSAPPRGPETSVLRYSLGMFGLSLPMNLVRGSMLFFYVQLLGMDARAYAVVMVVYAVIDAVDNPVLGWLSDRTRTRWGRRRPWIVVGSTLLAAAVVGFYSAPEDLSGLSLVVWFALFVILAEASDSMVSANYGALLPELFPGEARRSSANSLRQGWQLVAMVLALAVTPVLTTQVFGSEDSTIGFRTTAMIYCTIALAALLIMAFGIHERVAEHGTARQPRLWPTIKQILTHRTFWLIGVASACYLAPLAMVLAGVQLYVLHALKRPVGDALYLQGAVILAAAVGLVTWNRVVRRIGAPLVWRISFGILALGFVPLVFVTDLWAAVLAGLVVAAGWSGLMVTNDLIQARLLDADLARHGVRRESIYLAALGFFGRLSQAVNAVALGSLAVFFGFVSGDDPGPDPGGAFRVYMGVYPGVLAAVGLVLALIITVPDNRRPESAEEVAA